MFLDLKEVRKAVLGLVTNAVTGGVALLATKLGVDVAIVAPVTTALVGAATYLIYKIPNKVRF